MSAYTVIRSIYRLSDRILLRHLPAGARLRSVMFRLARRLFPDRIKARSASEFAGTAPSRATVAGHLPAWSREEVAALAQVEPSLRPLVADGAAVEPYFIPFDLNYVGLRYAEARRCFTGEYACMALVGRGATIDDALLASAPRPLAIIDVDGDAVIAQAARGLGADYLALPAGHLDAHDHCAVLARLVLQVVPVQVRYMEHPLFELCVQRHGLAMATVSDLQRWVAADING